MTAVLRRLVQDVQASTLLEFGLVGPAFLALLIGGFQFGMQMQNVNAVRGAANQAARDIEVAFQSNNDDVVPLVPSEMQTIAIKRAVSSPYFLQADQLDIPEPVKGTSTIAGADVYDLTINYTPQNWIGFFNPKATEITYTRRIYLAN